jgi:hypothetical protein
MSRAVKAFSAAALLLAGACSSGGAPANEPTACDASAGDAAASPDAGKGLYGNVTVEIIKDQYTAFLGTFTDGPTAPKMALQARQAQGGCTLYVPNKCAATCSAGSVLSATGGCMREPEPVAVGTLHVTGLGGEARDSEPTPPVYSYQLVPTLPYPACAEGGAIGVSADGFTLAATCVADLELTSAVPVPVKSGQAVHLTWKPPAQAGTTRVQVELEIAHHGGYKGQIDCDVPDTGTLDIPAPLVTALVALGRAGYPTVKIVRASTGTTAAQPNVALTVVSRLEVEADTGVISCGAGTSEDCAAGKTCQPDHTCR